MTLANLQADARFLSSSDSSSYGDTELNRNLNRWYHRAVGIAMRTMGDWEVSGDWATEDLSAGVREYPLPADLIKLIKVEAKLDGTNWRVLSRIDQKDSFLSDTVTTETGITGAFTNNSPAYDVFDNSLFIYSGSISTIANGLKIWFTDEITELANSTDQPNLLEHYQRYVSYGAAYDFALVNHLPQASSLRAEITNMERELEDDYSNRVERRLKITPRSDERARR